MNNTAGLIDEPGESAERCDADWGLVQQAQRGDKMAFEQLVLKHQRRAFNLAFRFFRNKQEAEDLTQEAFVQVHRHLRSFRGEAPFARWLDRIVANTCKNRIDYWDRRAGSKHDSLSDPIGGEGSHLTRELPDPKPNALEELSRQQVNDLIREELKAVDAEYQAILILRDVEDRPYEEIAQVLDVAIGTVKSRLHRARTDLLSRVRRRLGTKRSG